MYEAFYGLRERPFNLTPDPKYLYLSEKHKEAFAHLLYGIQNRSGFVMITGEIGTGKTTLCRNLLNQLDSATEVAFIFNPFLNAIELMKKINQEFGVRSDSDTILGLTEELNVHLLHSAAHGKNCVLVIDEAQNLSPQVLEQIRLLSNLETDTEKLLQIILIGQPELAEKLQLRELRQLNQRITARYHLKSLNLLETLQYIAYRIHVAGGRKRVNFTKRAIKQVYKQAGGVPRMINALCDRALLIGYTKEEHVITAGLVRQAMREIRGEKVTAPKATRFRWRRWLPAPSVAALLLLILALAHYLVDPVDRFARELRLFNAILSGDIANRGASEDTGFNPLVTADSVEKGSDIAATPPAADTSTLQLVMERLNASGSMRQNQSLATVLTSLDADATLRAGIDGLAALWNLKAAEVYPQSSKAEDLIAYFKGQGLDCEQLFPALEQLCAINLPGLAKMRLGSNDFWIGVVRANEQTVSLLVEAEKRITVSRDEFNLYYGRELLAPWQDPEPNTPILTAGQNGPHVLALKEQLRALGRLSPENTSDSYDKETEAAVKTLQEEAGLNPDGKAGRLVRLALSSWKGNTPSLRQDTAQTAMSKQMPAYPAKVSPAKTIQKEISAPKQIMNAAVTKSKEMPTSDKVTGNTQEETLKVIEKPVPAAEAITPPEAQVLAATGTEPVPADMDAPVPVPVTHAQPVAGTEDFLTWLRRQGERAVRTSDRDSSSAGQPTLMEVRELPSPAAEVPAGPSGVSSTVTAPVTGSAPLVPHGEVTVP